ncbi:MAG: hypothetical protein COW24_04890 [Candidatus Kerfeldbacteria bacterium CG15_BIG_FIL_POST_REV_8_21_14_020_45_12]|uniref:Methyltransferase domain-containing protein n=1 Tax=Candidatus Kerfeldbacteria bacterium CG15_BIG_FIL_POST_REV_8_21_14_020_45_12 TaxID=2014247 RepID=A0A2M7H2P3_9BACT|nr:MAG: hypothetical protein COW24_04890 [Candidatus Kerfeldbacteria bacterium CG15_BIG_FIL_POST_REV_8_21_14_020_45_12]PJA93248.1 MAG: hypothetical protein CO132_04030 [Candidatus Kerfeldbacteria bacterium CG_4_9_14_3_um_filter_45_8]
MANSPEHPAFSEDNLLNERGLLEHVGVDVGQTVADMGTGRECTFLLEAARMVSQTGKVYALDVVKEILEVVQGVATQAGLQNVETVWTDLEMYGAAKTVADQTIDIGILANTLSQSTDHMAMMKEAARMMKAGGRILVVEWKPVETVLGPPVAQRVSPEEIKQIALQLGIQVTDEFEAGEYHWALVLTK